MQGQGQGSSSNSFPGNFFFNGDLGSDQHDVVPDALVHDGHTSMRWIGQSSSSLDIQNHVCTFGQLLGDDFWLSPLGDQAAGTNRRSEDRRSNEPTFNSFPENISLSHSTFSPFLENISMSPCNVHGSSEHGSIGPSFLAGQESRSGPLQRNSDLNPVIVHEGAGIDASQSNGPYLSLDLFRAGTAASDRIPTSGGGSSPVMIYSGIAGYVLEENINRDGLPTDGNRRLLCKRRAPPEFASGQVISGDSSSSAQQAGNSEQSGITAPDNVVNRLNAANSSSTRLHSSHSAGLVATLTTPSNFHQIPTEARQVDNSQRNTRLRRTASQQIPIPASLWTGNSNNSNGQPAGQPSVFPPPFTHTSSAASAPVPANPAMQPMVQVSNSLQAPQPFQNSNGTTMSRVGSSSISLDHQTVNLREALGLADNRRNNRRNIMNSLANMQANLNLANENPSFIGNVASSSTIQAGSGTHLSFSSTRSPHPNSAEQYLQILRDIVDRSDTWRQGNYDSIHSAGASPAMRDVDVSVRGGIPRPAQVPQRLGPRAERQADHSGASPTVLSQTTAQRRRRLVAEVRNALGLVRRRGGLRFEDVMVIDRSVLFGVPEVPDIHEDMRLDVDNMSYEELLDLEEQIGNVGTGLSEEAILANLRRRKYHSIAIGPPVETEPCCICQEDYVNGEELGKLECGHDFHYNCIRQWLIQKNSCPICKKTALAI